MSSFGERLQSKRETRGITLEEISKSTKISSRALRALEEEKFDKLPGGIFNKGFVRAYARHLGIDEDEAVADFIAASGGDKEQPLPDPPVPRSVVLGQQRESRTNWRVPLAVALVLVAAITTCWRLGPIAFPRLSAITTRRKPKTAPPPAPLASVAPQKAAEPPALHPTMPLPPPPADAPEKKAPEQAKPVTVALEKAKPVTVAMTAPATESATPLDKAEAPPPETPSSAFVVQVRATKDAWVQIVADGKLFSEGVLVASAEKQVRATKEVVVKTGNAAGIKLFFNGKLQGALGEGTGMVTFTPEGIQH